MNVLGDKADTRLFLAKHRHICLHELKIQHLTPIFFLVNTLPATPQYLEKWFTLTKRIEAKLVFLLHHVHWVPTIDAYKTPNWKASFHPPHHPKTVKQSSSLRLFITPTSKRSKPTLVITALQKEGLLIISPLSLLHPQILDVSLLRSRDGWFGATHYTHFTICSNAQKMCLTEWGSLLQTHHRLWRKQATSFWTGGAGRRADILSHNPALSTACMNINTENNHNHNADKILKIIATPQ